MIFSATHKPIAIIGAGGLGREVATLCRVMIENSERLQVAGYFDDGIEKNTLVGGYPVLGKIDEIDCASFSIIIALGCPRQKQKVVERLSNRAPDYVSLVHPSVKIYDFQNIRIGPGSLIMQNTSLTCDITIGNHVLINQACSVGHDVVIHDYTSIMPGAMISGNVNIGRSCYVGTSASINNRIIIGDDSIVGAGAAVVKTVAEGDKMVGVPARRISTINREVL